jgi:hypothetical protein
MSVRNSRDVRKKMIEAGEVIYNGDKPEEWNESKEREAREADQEKANNERTQKLLLQGKSIVQYDERAIDNTKNLLGIRWLSRTCGALVIAPSGHGKSSFAIRNSHQLRAYCFWYSPGRGVAGFDYSSRG